MTEFKDFKEIERLVSIYIKENFQKPFVPPAAPPAARYMERKSLRLSSPLELDDIDFKKLYVKAKTDGETFSEMLLRLIKESGEKNSAVYNRANIDRRHFSKIATHKDYRPSKQTVLAFAFALELDFEQTKKLLATAGFTLSKTTLADVIISFFIENKIFDVDWVNRILYKYGESLLGG